MSLSHKQSSNCSAFKAMYILKNDDMKTLIILLLMFCWTACTKTTVDELTAQNNAEKRNAFVVKKKII